MLKKSLLIFATTLLVGCATSSNPDPSDFVISEGKSGLLVRATDLNGTITNQWLTVMKYDPEKVDEKNRPKATLKLAEVRLKVAGIEEGFIFKDLKPGHYMVRGFVQQDFWQTCFHDSSLKFEVKPDTIAYLGTWSIRNNSRQLLREVQAAGQTRSNLSQRLFYFDDILAPQISPPVAGELNQAQSFVARFSPESKAPVVQTNLVPAKFTTRKNLIGQRIC